MLLENVSCVDIVMLKIMSNNVAQGFNFFFFIFILTSEAKYVSSVQPSCAR